MKLAVVAAALVAAAACIDPSSPSSGPGAPGVDASVGRIQGTVADEELRPIAGANVVLVGTGLVTVSDDVGQFATPHVPPGTYTLEVSKPYHLTHSEVVEIVWGETTTVVVRLARVPGFEPYSFSLTQRGFIGCQLQWRTPAYSAGFAACQVPGTVAGVSGLDRSIIVWNVTAPFVGINGTVLEQQWLPTQAVGSGLRASLILYCYYVEGLGAVEGRSPLRIEAPSERIGRVVTNATAYNDPVANGDPVCGDRGATKSALACVDGRCRFQSSARPIPSLLGPSAAADIGLAVQQTFEQWLTTFVWGPVPEGFHAGPDA